MRSGPPQVAWPARNAPMSQTPNAPACPGRLAFKALRVHSVNNAPAQAHRCRVSMITYLHARRRVMSGRQARCYARRRCLVSSSHRATDNTRHQALLRRPIRLRHKTAGERVGAHQRERPGRRQVVEDRHTLAQQDRVNAQQIFVFCCTNASNCMFCVGTCSPTMHCVTRCHNARACRSAQASIPQHAPLRSLLRIACVDVLSTWVGRSSGRLAACQACGTRSVILTLDQALRAGQRCLSLCGLQRRC